MAPFRTTRTATRCLAALALVWAVAANLPLSAAPDFSRYIEAAAEETAPGQVTTTVRNISAGPLRNIVVRVRSRWQWSGVDGERGGQHVVNERIEFPEIVMPGQVDTNVAEHDPERRIPGHARYQRDVVVLELTTIGLDH